VISLDPELTALAHKLEPKLATGDLVSLGAGELYLLPSDVIAPADSLASSMLVAAAHSAGKKVWVWAVEDDAVIRAAVVRGVDGVIVSDVPRAKQVLQSMPPVTRSELLRERLQEVVGSLNP
jgi:glycerophosphoryl diester phosphodiesterase